MKTFLHSLLLAGMLAACSPENDSLVVVSVDGPSTVPAFYYLRVVMNNAGVQDYHQFPTSGASAPIALPTSLGFHVPRSKSGDITLSFDALNLQMQTVASGVATVTLKVGERTDLCVGLSPSAAGCQANPGTDAGAAPIDGGGAGSDAVPSRDSAVVPGGGFGAGLEFSQVSAGSDHTCAITTHGDLWCWGGNSTGQIGNGNTSAAFTPSKLAGAGWAYVTAGFGETCALHGTGDLWCWGNNGSGQLGGNFRSTTPVTIPLQVAGTGWTSVSAGEYHVAALQSDRSLWTWGDNSSDQLGDSLAVSAGRTSPVQVGSAQWIGLAAGSLHNCGIQADHTLWCWGLNSDGQLGDATTRMHVEPTQAAATDWATVVAGLYHTCAIRLDGTLWCWGSNANGQLGVVGGSSTSLSSPAQVSPGQTWLAVSAGQSHTCGIQSDQSLWCWGGDTDGQLGIASTSSSATPVAVAATTMWLSVSAGGSHTCAIASDSSLWCWGKNADGQLGLGGGGPRTAPARLGS